MEIKIFKIKSATTGLFSKGGQGGVFWSKKGKTWNQINHLKNHLRQYCETKIIKNSENWVDRVYDYRTKTNNIPVDWIVVEVLLGDNIPSQYKEYPARGLYPEEFPNN